MREYQKRELAKLKAEAKMLYKQGRTLREVGERVGKSYEWVRLVVNNLPWRKKGVNSLLDKN